MHDLRFLIRGIPIEQFKTLSFTDLIQNFYTKLKPFYTRQVSLEILDSYKEFEIEPQIKQELYRIIQEAVQNILKHSIGPSINIKLKWSHDLFIEIGDQGVGVNFNDPGSGLLSMQKRADRIGAKLMMGTMIKLGFTVRVNYPKPINLIQQAGPMR
jgi:signal transduction histidine kinase